MSVRAALSSRCRVSLAELASPRTPRSARDRSHRSSAGGQLRPKRERPPGDIERGNWRAPHPSARPAEPYLEMPGCDRRGRDRRLADTIAVSSAVWWAPGLQVASRARRGRAPMAGQQVEHVVERAHAGLARALAAAIEREASGAPRSPAAVSPLRSILAFSLVLIRGFLLFSRSTSHSRPPPLSLPPPAPASASRATMVARAMGTPRACDRRTRQRQRSSPTPRPHPTCVGGSGAGRARSERAAPPVGSTWLEPAA